MFSFLVILPNRPEHTFKCITINKNDGCCNTWTGAEQVDFVNSLACLDPLYDVLWCYQPQLEYMKCYNILAYDGHKDAKCCPIDSDTIYDMDENYEIPNFEDIKRSVHFESLDDMDLMHEVDDDDVDDIKLNKMLLLHHELAIPSVPNCNITRMHAALNLLACLDSLSYAHDTK